MAGPIEQPWHARRAAPRALLVVAGASAAVAAACIPAVDVPVARWVAGYEPIALWDRSIDAFEYTLLLPLHKLALPVLLVAGMLVTFFTPRLHRFAPAWMFVAGVHLTSRLTTNWLKDATGRLRPSEWLARRAGDTFGWQAGIAFPSGHVVLFASILIPVAVLYPRLRPALAVVGLVAVARIAVGAHWLSDTVAAITLVALWTYALGLLVRPCAPPPPASPRR